MKIIETALAGVKIIEPDVYGDERGFFMESWQEQRYRDAGIAVDKPFVQDNISSSKKNVLRGLHYQYKNTQAKLVYVLQGSVFDVAVDIRKGSPTYGQWFGTELTSDNKRQLYISEGFAHGFCVTSETVMFAYKCTDIYNPKCELSIQWNDHAIGIQWPVSSPTLSEKDAKAKPFAEIASEFLPKY